MTDFSDLQARITAALDRIGTGLEAIDKAGDTSKTEAADADELARLTEALEEERTANAQLEERVRAVREKQDQAVETLASEVERLRRLLEKEEAAVARLGQVNAELRANNAAMREAIGNGVAEPHLVNKAMMAELEGLRAARGADRAELDAVLGELGALVAEAEAGVRASSKEESADAGR
ncbi:hypothetical protein [Maritimibacter sp. HL-12]|uniref:hypothetical protein n=1 Tax=Maritimibacter sp. HL-12 TaxID=1162418 RepID=UPI000A0F051E|nr:hypothetical protein [Maritimibacter sp. HL-12]SMH57750.1 hypothetical protein SAMN05661107_3468 [Maritimibacter sp. HL-12]